MSFADLPTSGAGAGKTTDSRPYMEYTIPPAALGINWSGMPDEARTFRLVEIKPHEQDAAAKVAGSNPSALSRELIFQTVIQVGNVRTKKDRDFLERWWAALGPKGRRMVEAAFLSMMTVEEGDVETFLSAGRPGQA